MAKAKAKAKAPSFRTHPSIQHIAAGSFGVEQFEDALPLAIELDHALTKADKAALKSLYAGWCERIVEESAEDDDDNDGMSFARFDALFVGDRAIQGGASRFISAGKASLWLVRELEKLGGVSSITFGDPPDDGGAIAPAKLEEPPPEFTKLELVHEGKRMAALTFAISLYGAKPLQNSPQAVLACWKEFLALCPPGALTLWGTETTAPMNRKPVTTSTLGLLDKWLAKGAPKREYLAFDIGDEPTFSDAPRWRFVVWSRYQDKEDAHFIHLSMPYHVGRDRANDMVELAKRLFATGAFRSGTAGPCWNQGCFSSWTHEGNGAHHACDQSIARPGIDFQDTVDDSTVVGTDGLKGVGWLTLLDSKLAAEVAVASLPVKGFKAAGVTFEKLPNGVLIRCGAKPTLTAEGGEKAVAERVAPLIARTLPRTRWMPVAHDDEALSLGFRVRLSPWPEVGLVRSYGTLGKELLEAARSKDPAKTKKQFSKLAAAIRALAAHQPTSKVAIDDRQLRQQIVDHQIKQLAEHVRYAAETCGENKQYDLGLWMYVQCLELPGATADLYGALRVRNHANYVLSGIIPMALAAKDEKALAKHIPGAAKRANEQPDIHHALARAYMFLGDHAKALEHVRLGIETYEDSDEFKHDAPLEPIRAEIKKLLRGKKKR